MTIPLTVPLTVPMDIPVEGAEHGGHALGFLEPLVGFGVFALVLALLVAAYLLLRRRGVVPALSLPIGWNRTPAGPETTAKQVLAERFARGDISSEEFLERASALNWTPGGETYPTRRVGHG